MFRYGDQQQQTQRLTPMMAPTLQQPTMQMMQLPVVQQPQNRGEGFSWDEIKAGYGGLKKRLGIGQPESDAPSIGRSVTGRNGQVFTDGTEQKGNGNGILGA